MNGNLIKTKGFVAVRQGRRSMMLSLRTTCQIGGREAQNKALFA